MARLKKLQRSLRNLLGFTLAFALAGVLVGRVSDLTAQTSGLSGELERHVKYLTSEQLTGRGVDTPGIKLARDYIAAEFAKYGLVPGASNGSYFQSFEVAVGVKATAPSALTLGGEPSSTLTLNADWVPLGLSASDLAEGELVFVGYGITAKEYGYDDYEGIDVRGKIVLVLRYEPPPKDSDSPFKRHPDYSSHSALRTKANNAHAHGARGLILVDLHHVGDAKEELLPTASSLWRGGRSLAAAQVKRNLVEKWLVGRGISLPSLKEQIDRTERPASRPLPGLTLALNVKLAETRELTDNVVAVFPGADPSLRGENIVIGAHYDHVGMGHYGARDRAAAGIIHPGADDNASGTAVLLDVARHIAQLPIKPARTVVFVAFSAEELGLFGSRAFVNAGTWVESTKAMLNLDMVGRMRRDRLTVFGARSSKDFSAIVKTTADQLGLQVNESNSIGRSDHQSFYSRNIPVLHFFTGTHNDYHKTSDTWEKLNFVDMQRVSDLVMLSALHIANAKDPIAFFALPTQPPSRVGAGQPNTTYLGSIPDYGAEIDGVQLAGVARGSPAALAGLRRGDVIVALGNKKILNIDDLTAALRDRKPGDEVEIVVLRVGKPLALKARLRARG